jgi:hypothetical protein
MIDQLQAIQKAELDAIYAELDDWSERPDTFVAFVLCSGLGWAPFALVIVNGQWVLPSGGHEISPLTVSRPA